jgi:hypothetical protein
MKTGRLFRIEWGNPYCDPPQGAPRILAEIFVPGHPTRTPPELLAVPVSLGGGYSLTSRHIAPPARSLPQESLASLRRKRLVRRINARAPLFAEAFIEQELAGKPDYYDGQTDPGLETRRKAVLDREQAERDELWSRPNQLIIYGQEPQACRERSARLRTEIQAIKSKN